jgi:hypothetical protein
MPNGAEAGVRGDGFYHAPGEGRGEIHNSPNGHRANAMNPNNAAYAACHGGPGVKGGGDGGGGGGGGGGGKGGGGKGGGGGGKGK